MARSIPKTLKPGSVGRAWAGYPAHRCWSSGCRCLFRSTPIRGWGRDRSRQREKVNFSEGPAITQPNRREFAHWDHVTTTGMPEPFCPCSNQPPIVVAVGQV